MNRKTIVIKEFSRAPELGKEDRLSFTTGVNVITGRHNTGKSRILRMIDYVFGDDGTPEKVFGHTCAEKYDTARLVLEISGKEVTLERRWKEPGVKTKVFFNGEALNLKEFYYQLLGLLEIPVISYPHGNPYSTKAWPELAWRDLYRHIYRRQRFWTDLADQQYPTTQHACILQFLGLAQIVFSRQYEDLVGKEKRVTELQIAKDQYISMLQEVSRDLISERELGVALTPLAIDRAKARISKEIMTLEEKRDATVSNLIKNPPKELSNKEAFSSDIVQSLGKELSILNQQQEKLSLNLQKTLTRFEEINQYRQLLAEEHSRMERAITAGPVIADLKITNCPACDREIQIYDDPHMCHLCQRPLNGDDGPKVSPEKRLEFELAQLEGELEEADELLSKLESDINRLKQEEIGTSYRINEIQGRLRPARSAISSVLSPEISAFDNEIGQCQERLRQLEKIASSLTKRQALAEEIQRIQGEVIELNNEVLQQKMQLSFDSSSQVLGDSMNDYLNLLNESAPESWTQAEIHFYLSESRFQITVGREPWTTKLGGNLTLYFLLAYHYAIMSLTPIPEFNFPGLIILDFPAQLQNAQAIKDSENFVLEPYVNLLSKPEMTMTQLIAAGSSFENLEGVNRIELVKEWI